LHHIFQLLRGPFTVSNEAPDQPTLPIEYECLRNALIVTEILVGEFGLREAELIMNRKFFRVIRNLFAIVFTADVESDYLQTLLAITLLHRDQMRRFCPAGLAPGRVKIQHHNFALQIRQRRVLIILQSPAVRARFPGRLSR